MELYSLELQFAFEKANGEILERKGIETGRGLGCPANQFFAEEPFEPLGQMEIQQKNSDGQHECDPQHISYDFLSLSHQAQIRLQLNSIYIKSTK